MRAIGTLPGRTFGIAPAVAIGVPIAIRAAAYLPQVIEAGTVALASVTALVKASEGMHDLPAVVGNWAAAVALMAANSRPGRPGVAAPGVDFYPTGEWDPNGGNSWTFSISGMHWGPDPQPSFQTKTYTYTSGKGRVAWLELAAPSMSHNGVLEYDDGRIHEGPSMGVDGGQGLMGFLRSGGFLIDAKIRTSVAPASGSGVPFPQKGVTFPDGWAPPVVKPVAAPAAVPAAAAPVSAGVSLAPGATGDDTGKVVPVAPGAVAVPQAPALPGSDVGVPIPGGATGTGIDGVPVGAVPGAIPTTPADVHFPGGIPIASGGVRADLAGIAAEVGRIENKLGKLLSPAGSGGPDWLEKVSQLWDVINGFYGPGGYQLHGVCERDAEGNPIDSTREFGWPAGFSEFGSLRVRLDAIAEMLQYSKELKQPICRTGAVVRGEFVSVNFESDDPSPAGEKQLRKQLRYRDQTAAPLEAHVDHWRDFVWSAGPVIVGHKGAVWGEVQVWASTADEGKRVIRHAAAIAGVDLSAGDGQWIVSHAVSSRYGQPGVMRVRRLRNGAWMISKRAGTDGLPEYLAPVQVPVDPGSPPP